jgi:predicted dehydrogenase
VADRTVRFGIVGAGLMGRELAVATARWPALLDLDVRPELIAVCDINPALLEWYERSFGSVVLTTGDYRELLADERVEAVYCALPHHLHAEVYVDVIGAGKHLLGEKPFGIDRAANAAINAAIADHAGSLVRVSSEFPFYPGAQRVAAAVGDGRLGRIIEVRAGFLHSGDLDPTKPINWKRVIELNGEYGVMGDLGMHVVHLPFRFGWVPRNVRALLSNIVTERPDAEGRMVACETWDNAILATEVDHDGYTFPMVLETKRIAPGETDTWYLTVLGTQGSVSFTTKHPRTLSVMDYRPGGEQAWSVVDLGSRTAYRTITGDIFEFGFSDAILQMWAAYLDELAHGPEMIGPFGCATPEEAELSHRLFSAALESARAGSVAAV